MTDKVNELLRTVKIGEETIFDLAQAGNDGCRKIEITHRQLNPEKPELPVRAESPRRSHNFTDVDGFCAYLAKNKTANTVVFADVDAKTFYAVLDDKAEKGFEIVTMTPKFHPLFTPWNDVILDKEVTSKDFALFILKYRRSVLSPDGMELAMTFNQVRASKNIQIWDGIGKKAINGIKCELEIQGERKNEAIELPDSITISVPLFLGQTDEKEIVIDLVLSVNDDNEVVVISTSATVTDTVAKAFIEMLAAVTEKCGTDVTVTTGRPLNQNWAYLQR